MIPVARPALTLRLRLTLLYGGLLVVVAATLLGAAAVSYTHLTLPTN